MSDDAAIALTRLTAHEELCKLRWSEVQTSLTKVIAWQERITYATVGILVTMVGYLIVTYVLK